MNYVEFINNEDLFMNDYLKLDKTKVKINNFLNLEK